jgi:hypothetical protein
MLFFKVLFAALAGTALGWAAGSIAGTALHLALPPFAATYFASDRPTIKLMAVAFALVGCIIGLRHRPRSRWEDKPVLLLAERPMLSVAIAVLVGAGAAFFGSIAGLAAYSLAYEQLQRSAQEAVLEAEFAPFGFATAFALMALAIGLWLALRWRPRPAAPPLRPMPRSRAVQEPAPSLLSRTSVRVVLLAALAGVGGGWIGNYAGYALGVRLSGLLAMSGADGKDFIILCIVATTAALPAAAVWLVLRHYGAGESLPRLAARAAMAVAAIALVTPSALGLARRLDRAHEAIVRTPTIFFEVRLPADAPAPQTKDGIGAVLVTENGTTAATLYRNDWLAREGDRILIKGFIDHAAPARQRIVVFSLPGEPDRLFDLRLPRIPKSERHHGAWQRADFTQAPGEERRGAAATDDVHIRFHAWRPS